MSQWEKEFTVIKMIVRAIYGSTVIYAGLIYFRIPDIPYRWEQTQRITFAALILMVSLTSVIAALARQQISLEKLTEKFRSHDERERGLNAVISDIRTGAIIMAVMGDACAVFGLVLYILSGDSTRPWIFLALGVVHYPLIMMKLRKARDDFEHLSRGR
jgi:DMSO reductase anchor subunit